MTFHQEYMSFINTKLNHIRFVTVTLSHTVTVTVKQ